MRGYGALNAVLAALLALLVALHWGLEPNPQERGLEYVPEMVSAVPAESFSANPVLAGGMTLQPPPEGTIARGRLPLHLSATPEDALRAGEELENPFAADDPSAAERGRVIFARYCMLCHGTAGEGDGTVAQRGFPAPPSLLAPHAREMRDGQIFHIVSFGQGNMPRHAAQLDVEDRWRAVLRVRELQSAPAPTGPLPTNAAPASPVSTNAAPTSSVPTSSVSTNAAPTEGSPQTDEDATALDGARP